MVKFNVVANEESDQNVVRYSGDILWQVFDSKRLAELVYPLSNFQNSLYEDTIRNFNSKIVLILRCGKEILLVRPNPNKSEAYSPVQGTIKLTEDPSDLLRDICYRKLERGYSGSYDIGDSNKVSLSMVASSNYSPDDSSRLTDYKPAATYYCFVVDVPNTFDVLPNISTSGAVWIDQDYYISDSYDLPKPRDTKLSIIKAALQNEANWADCTHWFE
jgi:hypothetical protein